MKKTLAALSLISVALFSAHTVAGPGSTEYTYKNGDKIRVVTRKSKPNCLKMNQENRFWSLIHLMVAGSLTMSSQTIMSVKKDWSLIMPKMPKPLLMK